MFDADRRSFLATMAGGAAAVSTPLGRVADAGNVAAAISGADVVTYPTFITKGAQNLPKISWYWAQPWADLMKSAGGWSNTAGVATDGWLALPAGATYYKTIFSDTKSASLRKGQYYVTYPAVPGLVVTMRKTGTDANIALNANSTPGKYGFTIDGDNVSGTTRLLWLYVQNTSGAAINIRKSIQIYHAENEALLRASPYACEPYFIKSLCECDCIRAMDWLNTIKMGWDSNNVETKKWLEFSDFRQLDDCTWAPEETGGGVQSGAPPAAVAMLAKQMNAQYHIAIPPKCTATCMLNMAKAIASVGGQFKVVVEYGNEIWNGGGVFALARNWLAGTYAAQPGFVINFNGTVYPYATANNDQRIAAAFADGSMRAWNAFESILGDRVVRMYCAQNASPGNLSVALTYVARRTISPGYTGKQIKQLLNVKGRGRYATAPYNTCALGGIVTTLNQWAMYFNLSMLTDAYFSACWKNFVDGFLVGKLEQNRAHVYKTNGMTNCEYSSYEFDLGTDSFSPDLGIAPLYPSGNVLKVADTYFHNFSYGKDVGAIRNGVFYISKVANNSHAPAGITDDYWLKLGDLSGWISSGEYIRSTYYGNIKPYSDVQPAFVNKPSLKVTLSGTDVSIYNESAKLTVYNQVAGAVTYINATSFSIAGNLTAYFTNNSLIVITGSLPTIFARIASSNVDGTKTIVNLSYRTADLNAGVAAVALTFNFANRTRSLAIMNAVKTFLNGAGGRDATVYAYNKLFKGACVHCNWYYATSDYDTNYGSYFGLNLNPYLPDTPRQTWFRSLKN